MARDSPMNGRQRGTFRIFLILLGSLCGSAVGQLQCAIANSDRVDCGFRNINQAVCENDRNCCFDNTSGVIQCFQPGECVQSAAQRLECGFDGIERAECLRRSCCFDEMEDTFQCFVKSTDATRAPLTGGCDLLSVYNSVLGIVNQWRDLIRRGNFRSILQNSNLFSLSTYCGIYAQSIDSITRCVQFFGGPFIALNEMANNSFYQTLNKIQDAKGFCGSIVANPANRVLCVPGAIGVCSLLSFDILVTYARGNFDVNQVCQMTEMVIRGIPTCITLSTGGCSQEQQRGYDGVRQTFLSIANYTRIRCRPGCVDLVKFFLDDPSIECTWNIGRRFPNPNAREYCRYARFVVDCAWMLYQSCNILPRRYFENALTVLDTAFVAGGCGTVSSILAGFSFNPEFQINIPPCVTASIECARQLAFAVGVEELAGPFNGYSFSQVDTRISIIGQQLKTGNYEGFCGNPSQRAAPGNPISNCLTELLQHCGSQATELQIRIVNTTAQWYDEVCSEGCTTLGEKLINFRTTCPLPDFDINPRLIPLDVFTFLSPNGSAGAYCRPVRDFAVCIGQVIEDCTFLHRRLLDARNLLVRTVTGGRDNLPVTLYICGVKLDYPFKPDLSQNNPGIRARRNASSTISPFILLSILTTVLAILGGIHHKHRQLH